MLMSERSHCSGLVLQIIISLACSGMISTHEYFDTDSITLTSDGETIETTLTRSGHRSQLTLTIEAFNKTFTLDLFLNTRLLAANYEEKSISATGETYNKCNHTSSHCFYIGSVRDDPTSSAAISTCRGIEGNFVTGNDSYHITALNTTSRIHPRGRHRIQHGYNDSLTRFLCGANNFQKFKHSGKLKRSLPYPQNSDRQIDVVELYLAFDFDEYKSYQSDVNQIYQRAKVIANLVSSFYQVLDIYVVLVGVEVWQSSSLISIVSDSTATLNNWYTYRRTNINPTKYNDNAFLVTKTAFQESVVGKANVGSMCQFMSSGGIATDAAPSNAGVVAAILAHEMGHNFGLVHDASSCGCTDASGTCIMYPQTMLSNPSKKFSACSTDMLQTARSQGIDACLKNIPQTVFQNSQICGNGIVDEGEQCDCGNAPSQECNPACCNSTTCQLMSPATCASGKCCDVTKCQLLSLGSVCRPVIGDCDLPEYCSGTSALCPGDFYKHDGLNCSSNGVSSFCYGGLCRNHQSQCQLLWGTSVSNSAQSCYTRLNTNGQHQGNCGVTGWNSGGVTGYIPCAQKDVMCGKLQCNNNNAQLSHYSTFYLQSTASIGNAQCMSVIIDLGLQVPDPGLVPDGANCGTNMMCVSQKCINSSTVLNTNPCPSCLNDGVCNNVGHCHCPSGYGPADCSDPGSGGSPDSGPMVAFTPPGSKALTIGLCVFFLVILPLLVLGAYLCYRYRAKLQSLWEQTPWKKSSGASRNANGPPPTKPTYQPPIPPSAPPTYENNGFHDVVNSAADGPTRSAPPPPDGPTRKAPPRPAVNGSAPPVPSNAAPRPPPVGGKAAIGFDNVAFRPVEPPMGNSSNSRLEPLNVQNLMNPQGGGANQPTKSKPLPSIPSQSAHLVVTDKPSIYPSHPRPPVAKNKPKIGRTTSDA